MIKPMITTGQAALNMTGLTLMLFCVSVGAFAGALHWQLGAGLAAFTAFYTLMVWLGYRRWARTPKMITGPPTWGVFRQPSGLTRDMLDGVRTLIWDGMAESRCPACGQAASFLPIINEDDDGHMSVDPIPVKCPACNWLPVRDNLKLGLVDNAAEIIARILMAEELGGVDHSGISPAPTTD